jgi:hypothetical protein
MPCFDGELSEVLVHPLGTPILDFTEATSPDKRLTQHNLVDEADFIRVYCPDKPVLLWENRQKFETEKSPYRGALRACQPRGSCRRRMPHTPGPNVSIALRSRCA